MNLRFLFFIGAYIKGLDLCNTFVCLTWTVHTGHLDLQCRVNYLIYGIEIFNNRRKELGFCLHPQPVPKCFSYSNDTTIMQNSKTNITYLKIKGHINSNLNGQWECRHGTNRDNATINVTVLNSGSRGEDIVIYNKRCWQPYLAFTTLGFFCTKFVFLGLYLICQFTYKETEWQSLKQRWKKKLNLKRGKKANKILRIVPLIVIIFLILLPVIKGAVDRNSCDAEASYLVLGVICATAIAFLALLSKTHETIIPFQSAQRTFSVKKNERAQPSDTDIEVISQLTNQTET